MCQKAHLFFPLVPSALTGALNTWLHVIHITLDPYIFVYCPYAISECGNIPRNYYLGSQSSSNFAIVTSWMSQLAQQLSQHKNPILPLFAEPRVDSDPEANEDTKYAGRA